MRIDDTFQNLDPETRKTTSLLNQTYSIYLVAKIVNDLAVIREEDLFFAHISATKRLIQKVEALTSELEQAKQRITQLENN
jgi:phosphoribosylaminoimidazole (AIR) synthetase